MSNPTNEPRTPPPEYEDVVWKEKPPSYESQVRNSDGPQTNENEVVNTQPRNLDISTNRRRYNNDIGCEPYYGPENNCLVCLFCNLFCRPITTCCHACEECCEDEREQNNRRRYYDDNYYNANDYGNNYVYDSGGDNSGDCWGGNTVGNGDDNTGDCWTGANSDTGGGGGGNDDWIGNDCGDTGGNDYGATGDDCGDTGGYDCGGGDAGDCGTTD